MKDTFFTLCTKFDLYLEVDLEIDPESFFPQRIIDSKRKPCVRWYAYAEFLQSEKMTHANKFYIYIGIKMVNLHCYSNNVVFPCYPKEEYKDEEFSEMMEENPWALKEEGQYSSNVF